MILLWIQYPYGMINVRKHPDRREKDGHCHLNNGTQQPAHLLIEITCIQNAKLFQVPKEQLKKIEFYDSFWCVSGLKSTYPNWSWVSLHVLRCMTLHITHYNAGKCCRGAARLCGMCEKTRQAFSQIPTIWKPSR